MADLDESLRRDYERLLRFGYDPQVDDLLDRHLARIGVDKTARTDASSSYRISVLRSLLAVVEAALADEHVDPVTARRVIERVIYGGSPNPTDAQERIEMNARMTELVKAMPVRVKLADLEETTHATDA